MHSIRSAAAARFIFTIDNQPFSKSVLEALARRCDEDRSVTCHIFAHEGEIQTVLPERFPGQTFIALFDEADRGHCTMRTTLRSRDVCLIPMWARRIVQYAVAVHAAAAEDPRSTVNQLYAYFIAQHDQRIRRAPLPWIEQQDVRSLAL